MRPRLESAGLTTFEAWQQFSQRTPVADCWCLIDPSRKPQSDHRVRQVPVLESKCYRCFGGIEFSENGIGHRIKCPHCGQITKLGVNPFATPLGTTVEIRFSKCEPAPAGIPPPLPERKRAPVIPLGKLTEETIRARTKRGDTPLHRAAKNGTIHEIPRHLLQTELFMVAKNGSFSTETPLHTAARYGHLDQVPVEFLTKETLTVSAEYEEKESRTGPTPPRTETPLHVAVRCGHGDQIPQEFLTPEFLSIEATGYRNTLLHYLTYASRLNRAYFSAHGTATVCEPCS